MKDDTIDMKFKDIKPLGNYEEILKNLRKKVNTTIENCNKEKTYNTALAIQLKFTVDIMQSLTDGVLTDNVWDIEEAKMCLLYIYLIIIDLNSTAHFYLNNIEIKSQLEQLQEYVDGEKRIFGNIKLI